MTVPHLNNAFWVVPRGNDLILYDSMGNEVPKQIGIRVTADIDCFPVALVRFLVNIAKDEEEMKAKIEEDKDKHLLNKQNENH